MQLCQLLLQGTILSCDSLRANLLLLREPTPGDSPAANNTLLEVQAWCQEGWESPCLQGCAASRSQQRLTLLLAPVPPLARPACQLLQPLPAALPAAAAVEPSALPQPQQAASGGAGAQPAVQSDATAYRHATLMLIDCHRAAWGAVVLRHRLIACWQGLRYH